MLPLQSCIFEGLAAGGGLPFAFIGADGQTNKINTGTTISLVQPPDTLIGNLVLSVMCANGGARTWSGPAGMDERADQSALPNLRVATKTADTNGLANLGNATCSTSSDLAAVTLAIAHGAYDTIGSFGTRSGTGTLTAPSITMSEPGLLLGIAAMQDSGGTITGPGTMELLKNYGSGVYPELSIFTEYVAPGATGSRVFTIGGTAPGACSAVLVGIKRG